jgi:hypothetical protein
MTVEELIDLAIENKKDLADRDEASCSLWTSSGTGISEASRAKKECHSREWNSNISYVFFVVGH